MNTTQKINQLEEKLQELIQSLEPISQDPMGRGRPRILPSMCLWVGFLTLIEFVVRRKLKQNQEKLVGLIENNPKKGIDNPTTEKLLKMFDNNTRTNVQLPDQKIRHLPALTAFQIRILELLGLSEDVYTRLSYN
jgi:hypothetical protein